MNASQTATSLSEKTKDSNLGTFTMDNDVYGRCKMVFIKHFDIEQQRLQFVGNLLIEPDVTVRDVVHFLEHRFVPNLCRERDGGINKWYHRLSTHLQAMNVDADSQKLALYCIGIVVKAVYGALSHSIRAQTLSIRRSVCAR